MILPLGVPNFSWGFQTSAWDQSASTGLAVSTLLKAMPPVTRIISKKVGEVARTGAYKQPAPLPWLGLAFPLLPVTDQGVEGETITGRPLRGGQ